MELSGLLGGFGKYYVYYEPNYRLMETLKDFLSTLKERFTNPFIASFLVAWLVANYQIPIALLFYSQTDLKKYHNKTYLEFISACQNNETMIFIPLGIAIAYTLVFPFVKAGINVFNAWLTSKTDTQIYSNTKHHTVSVELHSKVASDFRKLQGEYVELINGEETISLENAKLKAENTSLTLSYAESIRELTDLNEKRFKQLQTEEINRVAKIQESANNSTQLIQHDYSLRITSMEGENKQLRSELDIMTGNWMNLNNEVSQKQAKIQELETLLQGYSK